MQRSSPLRRFKKIARKPNLSPGELESAIEEVFAKRDKKVVRNFLDFFLDVDNKNSIFYFPNRGELAHLVVRQLESYLDIDWKVISLPLSNMPRDDPILSSYIQLSAIAGNPQGLSNGLSRAYTVRDSYPLLFLSTIEGEEFFPYLAAKLLDRAGRLYGELNRIIFLQAEDIFSDSYMKEANLARNHLVDFSVFQFLVLKAHDLALIECMYLLNPIDLKNLMLRNSKISEALGFNFQALNLASLFSPFLLDSMLEALSSKYIPQNGKPLLPMVLKETPFMFYHAVISENHEALKFIAKEVNDRNFIFYEGINPLVETATDSDLETFLVVYTSFKDAEFSREFLLGEGRDGKPILNVLLENWLGDDSEVFLHYLISEAAKLGIVSEILYPENEEIPDVIRLAKDIDRRTGGKHMLYKTLKEVVESYVGKGFIYG